MPKRSNIAIFSDASVDEQFIGCGYVIRIDRLLVLGATRVPHLKASSLIAEAVAAEVAFGEVGRRATGPGAKVHFLLDNTGVVKGLSLDPSKFKHRYAAIDNIRRLASEIGVTIEANWVRSYRMQSTGLSFLNGIAGRLSTIGLTGEVINIETPLSPGWRQRLLSYDPRLDPSPPSTMVTGAEAAELLGVPYDTILSMVRNKELPVDPETGAIPRQEVLDMVQEDCAGRCAR